MRRYRAFWLLFLPGVAAFGQLMTRSSFTTLTDGKVQGSATFDPPRHTPQPVAGAPYYGEEVSEHVQTLANGVHITQTNQLVKTWRDSQGRTRTERPITLVRRAQADLPVLIQITDPLAGYVYVLDAEKRIAHRVAAPPQETGPRPLQRAYVQGSASSILFAEAAAAAPAPEPKRSAAARKPDTQAGDVTNEVLGTQTVEGVAAEGTRQTIVYPTGSHGNDAPFSVVSENWWSRELQLTVLSTRDDPRSGVETQKIVNLSTQEPDPALFMVPAGYTVVDETASFTITWGAQEPGSQQQ